MTEVTINEANTKMEFSKIKKGTFFIFNNDLHLKTEDDEAYNFKRKQTIPADAANDINIIVVDPEIMIEEKLVSKSSSHTSGDSTFALHEFYSQENKSDAILIGDFYKTSNDNLHLRISDTKCFSFKYCESETFHKEFVNSSWLVFDTEIDVVCGNIK